MNRRSCPGCAERYPLRDGVHHLPDGSAIACEGVPEILDTGEAPPANHFRMRTFQSSGYYRLVYLFMDAR